MRVLVTGGSGFIGTRVVEEFLRDGHELLNLDIKAPAMEAHRSFWRTLNVVDGPAVRAECEAFHPEIVVHMAARTDTLSRSLDDYRENILGTDTIIDVVRAARSGIRRVVFFSTQFVNQSDVAPRDDTDFAPHTAYGQSKVINEKAIRAADLSCEWAIVRPTNIWGPWHPRYPTEFWRILKKGLYVHPSGRVTRSYGYVGNLAHQLRALLLLDSAQFDKQVFYLGDAPLDLYDWANGFSERLVGRKVTVVPRLALRAAAMIGDTVTAAGARFPITSSRYKSMTTDNPAPMAKTLALLGGPAFTLEQGIEETVAWLIEQDPNFWLPGSPRSRPEERDPRQSRRAELPI